MTYTIVSYCCGSYPSVGGVARYDAQLNIIFPSRVFFQGPGEKNKMIEFLKKCPNPIVITDNHLSCDIPNEYPILLVHHGCAQTHADREPDWDKYWRDLCCNGQNQMLTYRNPSNTWIISISQFCTDEFNKYYSNEYRKFKNIKIQHTSEFDESKFKNSFNANPIILGNWSTENKGLSIVNKLSCKSKYNFKKLLIKTNKSESLESFNKRKQQIYLDSDIFLQLSVSEGNSYATLDAMLCGLVIVASDVGLFYSDVPENCFVKIPWEKNNDVDYVLEKINWAWENKETLSKNAREWYLANYKFSDWTNKMYSVVNEFQEHVNSK